MSNRKQAFNQPQSNPATKFIEWKSNDKCFSYFDSSIAESLKGSSDEEIKEKSNVKIKLPFKFLVLDEMAFVKGWSDSLRGTIISNEVKFISKEILTVKCFHKNVKGEKTSTEITKGIYKEIKEKVNSAGAKYHKSIYVMLEDGSLANIKLKGASVQKWGEFTQRTKSRLPEEWVIVKASKEDKKGAVKFSVPEFSFERSLSDAENEQADACFDVLETYLKAYLVKSEPAIEEVIEEEENQDPLDF